MRLGIFSDHLREYARAENLSCREAAELFGQYGVCETEIGYGEWGEQSPGAYADSFGLRVRCVHGVCSLCSADPKKYEEGQAQARRIIDTAAELGAEFALLVPGLPDEVNGEADRFRAFVRCCEGLREAVLYGWGRSVRVTIENFSSPILPFSRADDLARMFREVEGLVYTLDAGNFTCFGERLLDAQRRLPSPSLVHFKDWLPAEEGFGNPPMDGAPYGTGIVPLRDCYERLRGSGFDGTIILEHNAMHFDPDDLVRCAEFMKALLAQRR